jgi:hypothetical protein
MSSSPGIVSFPPLVQQGTHCLQSAFPKSDGNLFEWIGTIEGATGTVKLNDPEAAVN